MLHMLIWIIHSIWLPGIKELKYTKFRPYEENTLYPTKIKWKNRLEKPIFNFQSSCKLAPLSIVSQVTRTRRNPIHTNFPEKNAFSLGEDTVWQAATSFSAASDDIFGVASDGILGLVGLTPSFLLQSTAPQWQSWSAPNWTNLQNLFGWSQKY